MTMDEIIFKEFCDSAQSSGKQNRFCWLKARIPYEMLKAFRGEPIYKVVYNGFFIGSEYEVRELAKDPEFQMSGKPYPIGRVTENGVVRYKKSDPSVKYIWVYKATEKDYKKVYVDHNGTVLTDYEKDILPKVRKHSSGDSAQRIYKLENIFEVSINGKTYVDKEMSAIWDKYLI